MTQAEKILQMLIEFIHYNISERILDLYITTDIWIGEKYCKLTSMDDEW